MSDPTAADRLLRAFRILVPSTMPEARFHGLYEYEVTGSSEGTVDARPADPDMGLPDLADVPILPSPLGELVTADTGSMCAIMFLDGKPTKPRCVSIEGTADTSKVYAGTIELGTSTPGIGHAMTVEQFVGMTNNLLCYLAINGALAGPFATGAWVVPGAATTALNLLWASILPVSVVPGLQCSNLGLVGGDMTLLAPSFTALAAALLSPLPALDPLGTLPGVGRSGVKL